jgi:hypothetical protein
MARRKSIEDYVKFTRIAVMTNTCGGSIEYKELTLIKLLRTYGLNADQIKYCMKDLHVKGGNVDLD